MGLVSIVAIGSLCIAASAVVAQPEIKDTVLFREVDGKLYQMVQVMGVAEHAEDWTIEINGKSFILRAGEVLGFKDGWLLPVAAVDTPTLIKIINAGVEIEHTLKPQKRWTAYITPHTHFDLGFTDVQTKLWSQLTADMKDILDLCDRTDNWPDDCKYRWNIECSSLLEEFARRYPDQMPRMIERLKQGRIEVNAGYTNMLTELCSGEELCRSFYPIERFREQYGITVDTAMHNDIAGITWQMPQLYNKAGVKCLSFRSNPVRAKLIWDRPEALTRPFIWQSPDGSSVILWYTDSYREANFFREDCPEAPVSDWMQDKGSGAYDAFLGLIARQEKKGTPVDAIQMRMGGDNLPPTINSSLWVKAWNELWAYPRMIVATNRMFFDHIERFRSQLETHAGDIPDWWADGAGSSARETGMNRRNHDRIALAEQMQALFGNQMIDTWDAYRQILLFEEHTWGSDMETRTEDPAKAAEEWRIKSAYAFDADRMTRDLLNKSMNNLINAIGSDRSTRLLVWNPLPWSRSGIVDVDIPEGQAAFDIKSGKQLQMQKVGDKYAVLVTDIPAVGWKCFDIKCRTHLDPSAAAPVDDPESVPISYIYETGPKREKFNPYTYNPRYDRKRDKRSFELVRTETGPLFTTRTYKLTDSPGAYSAELKTRSYPETGNVEVEFHLNKISTDKVEDVYLEFPFDLKNPTVHASVPLGWINPATDRLPCTCGDFFSIDRAVDVNDGSKGVTWVSLEAPLIQFGKITTGDWSDDFTASNGTVYSYVMNNEWFTNYCFSQGGQHTFRYVYRQYDGPFDPAAASRFGEEAARPLETRVVEPGERGRWADTVSWSAFCVEPGNMLLETVKTAEDGKGVILRLVESAGKRSMVRLKMNDLISSTVHRCSLLEKDKSELPVKDGVVEFTIEPWEVATLHLGT